MSRHHSTTTDLALIAGFAGFIAVCSVIAIPVGPAPITLQTFAVLLAGAVLGPTRAFLAVLLYLVIGIIGLPVFAGGMAGPAPFAGPTAGYLAGMPLAAWLTGVLTKLFTRSSQTHPPAALTTLYIFAAALLANIVFIYTIGILGLALRAQLTFTEAFFVNLSFVPFDLVKITLTAIVATAVHRAFPGLLKQHKPKAAVARQS